MIHAALLLAAWAGASGFSGYRATKADFELLEHGISGAAAVADSVFPEGIDRIDVVLYDAKYLYIYSRSSKYPFKKLKKWGKYQVYRVPHKAHPSERELARCASRAEVIGTSVVTKLSEQYFTCAPWGTFGAIQKKRKSIYQHKDGYLASVIHEFGHQYQDQQPNAIRSAVDVAEKIDSFDLPPDIDRDSAKSEGYASWCELVASKKLYPAHHARLLDLARDKKRKDDSYGHDAGLRAAVEVESGLKTAPASR